MDLRIQRESCYALFSLISGVLFASSPDVSAAVLTRGPYLQVGTPTSIIVRWRTDVPVESRLLWGTNLASLDSTNSQPVPTTEHELRVQDLSPSTRYYYAVVAGDTELSAPGTNQYWITSPAPGQSHHTRFWLLGDMGINTADQTGVLSAYRSAVGTNHTDLILLAGDDAYWSGFDYEYQAGLFAPFAPDFRKTPVWPALGNHDTAQLTNDTFDYPYYLNFTMPTNGEAGGVPSGTESYYSFDFADLHFVSLNSYTADRSTNGPMATWLRADLAANRQPWLVAYWHHPPYSRGSHDADNEVECVEMRQNFVTLLEEYGVDLVLCGHSHTYERSFLLDGHYGMRPSLASSMIRNSGNGRESDSGPYFKPSGHGVQRGGAVYVVAGNAAFLVGGPLDDPAMCVSSNMFGSLLCEVSSNRLDAFLLSPGGYTNDSFTIVKTNFAPEALAQNRRLGENRSIALAVFGTDPNRDPVSYRLFSAPAHGVVRDFDPLSGALTYTPSWGFVGFDSLAFQATDGTLTSLVTRVDLEVVPARDTNQNHLPDIWEKVHQVSDPLADDDQDGQSNLQEYLAGTDPRDPNSRLRISLLSGSPASGFTLAWPSIGGVRYRVLFGDAPLGTGFPTNLTAIIRSAAEETDMSPYGMTSTLQFFDNFSRTGEPSGGARYYRLQVVQ